MFDYGLLNVNNSLREEERRAVCGTRIINSQVEEEEVGVCKQLMDFSQCVEVQREEEEWKQGPIRCFKTDPEILEMRSYFGPCHHLNWPNSH